MFPVMVMRSGKNLVLTGLDIYLVVWETDLTEADDALFAHNVVLAGDGQRQVLEEVV